MNVALRTLHSGTIFADANIRVAPNRRAVRDFLDWLSFQKGAEKPPIVFQIRLMPRFLLRASAMNSTTPTSVAATLSGAGRSVRCALIGHKVHYTRIARYGSTPCVRCGAGILDQDNSASRVAHTLSCFFGKHHYVPISTRAAHHEYVCEKCGHPLLFESARDPYSSHARFKKRVNYACGLFGHRVHVVTTGSKVTEYACRCGHSFVKAQGDFTTIRHPLACVLLGHFILAREVRGQWAEYVCRRCGHPFYFRSVAFGKVESNLQQGPYE